MPNPQETPEDFTWHESYIGGDTNSVPDMIVDTTDLVKDMLEEAKDRSDDALDIAQQAIWALQDAKLPEPLPDPPIPPRMETGVNVNVGFGMTGLPNLGGINWRGLPGLSIEDVLIPDISSEIPEYVQLINGLSLPSEPVMQLPQVPQSPAIDTTVNIPAVPVASYGEVPELVELNLPVYVAPVLPVFNAPAPEFNEQAPDPFIQWQEPEYTSEIADDVKLVLLSMLAGGTGLPAAVEQAIWDRARGRIDASAAQKIDEARNLWASRGHSLPPGMLNRQILTLLDQAAAEANEVSLSIAIEQAKLEQSNRQFAVQQGIAFEQLFVSLFLATVDRNFQIAKFAVETQIQVFNLKVTAFTAKNAAFMAQIEKYKAELEVAFAYIRAFEAQVKAEVAKGEINEQRLRAYTAKVAAYNSQVEAFKTLVQAEAIRVDIEKGKIDIFRGEIDAYVGEINGQRAVFEAYGERVRAEASKAGLEEANAKAYQARIQGIAAKSDVLLKGVDAQIAKNRLTLDYTIANMQQVVTLGSQELQVIQARAAMYEADLRRATAKFGADSTGKQMEITSLIEGNRTLIAHYTARLEAWRAQAAHILQVAGLSAESMRAVGSIAGTLAAGAMAGTHVSAGISGSASASQGKSENTSRQRSFNQQVSDQSSYNVNHHFNH